MREYTIKLHSGDTTVLLSDEEAAARGLTPAPKAKPAPESEPEPKAKAPANKSRTAANKRRTAAAEASFGQ